MKFFWHGCDYNLILEKILDSKCFSSNSKSLMLSMFYKLEEFYADYQKVKNIDITKEEFLNLILDTVKKYCDNIKLVEPDKAELLKKNDVLAVTNENERSILCYPTEISLLYAIADIMPKYFYISDSFEYKNSLQRVLVNGYNLNVFEILSDFNGWSWDVNINEKKYFQDSLIYQNFIILFGSLFMEDWKSRNNKEIDSFSEIKNYFSKTYYFDLLQEYLICELTKKEKNLNEKELEIKRKELDRISNKITYFEMIKLKKLKYLKELEKITLLLNNKELIRKEYLAQNMKLSEEKRIATLGHYKNMLESRKEKIVTEIAKLTASMNPVNYINKKRKLEKFIQLNDKNDNNKDDIIIKLQKEFIKLLKDICFETEDINSLKNLTYKIRYYRYLFITNEKRIKDIPELNNSVNEILKQVLLKLVNYQCIKRITNDDLLNEEILLNILDTKVINLELLKYEVDIKDSKLKIKTYEKEVFEKEFEIDGIFNKKMFNIKQEKIYKLFI